MLSRGKTAAGRKCSSENGAVKVAGRPREDQPKEIRNTDPGQFGRHLAELIQARDLTVQEFAVKIGKTPAVVNFYIKRINTPPLKAWRKIAKVLGLKNVKDLLPSLPGQ